MSSDIATQDLYINEGGMTVCPKHGGNYMTSYLKAHPGALMFDTPLDNWVKADKETVEYLTSQGLGCEGC